jgi:excisionase family DNA binding protein
MDLDTTPIVIKPLLTLRQTAATLHISEVTLRRLVKAGTGPKARRIGKSLRFREQDVQHFVETK